VHTFVISHMLTNYLQWLEIFVPIFQKILFHIFFKEYYKNNIKEDYYKWTYLYYGVEFNGRSVANAYGDSAPTLSQKKNVVKGRYVTNQEQVVTRPIVWFTDDDFNFKSATVNLSIFYVTRMCIIIIFCFTWV